MTAPLTYNIDAAAERLGGPFTRDWLKKHLHEVPHIKSGKGTGRAGRIAFTEHHLLQIVELFSIEPTSGPAADSAPITRRRAS